MGIINYLALDKFAKFFRIISQNGGPIRATLKFWRFDTLKDGRLVGKDAAGNLYFKNDYYMMPRNRWVEHNDNFKWEYDASQITAEWFGWLHHKTDKLPSEDKAKQMLNSCCWVPCWLQPHVENLSGTEGAFYPYNTIKSHVKVWDGTYLLIVFLACLLACIANCHVVVWKRIPQFGISVFDSYNPVIPMSLSHDLFDIHWVCSCLPKNFGGNCVIHYGPSKYQVEVLQTLPVAKGGSLNKGRRSKKQVLTQNNISTPLDLTLEDPFLK